MPSDDAENTMPRQVKCLRSLLEARSGLYGVDLVALAAILDAIQRTNIDHARLGKNFRTALFRQIKIVLIESVLGAVTAAHHAAATAAASSTLGTFAAEVWIGDRLAAGLSLRRLKYRYMGPIEAVSNSY